MILCLGDYLDLITLSEMQTPSPHTESYYIASWHIYIIYFFVIESSDSNVLEILMVCNSTQTVIMILEKEGRFMLFLPAYNIAT